MTAKASELADAFRNPTEETKPWCYWYWLNGNVSKEGITKDLEAMAKVGIKLAMIGNIHGQGGETGSVKMLSPDWYELTHHAFREANRLLVELMMFNAPGWSQSGGPWIKPEQSMRRVTWSEFPAQGGEFSQKVRPDGSDPSQDIAVLAVPRLAAVSIDGAPASPAPAGSNITPGTRFSHAQPFTARSLIVHGTGNGKLYALRDGERQFIADIHAGGGKPNTDFLPDALETFSFPDVTGSEFELVPAFACRVELSSAPRVAQVIEKQMGRMHPTPSPTWESYIFPDTAEPDDAASVVKKESIIDLSDKLSADGVLSCTLPAGDWTVIHFGMVTTGRMNAPAAPEATGLEVDKMSKAHIRHHFDSSIGPLMKGMTPAERAAFKGITIDSYEVGAQNWTDGFAAEFEKRNGYNPILLLPVMTGRVVDAAKTSDQFLWDLRRTVADMIAEYYVGGLREIANENGLRLWCENYGHWGFPGEFLNYGGYTDEIGGEFWTTDRSLGTIESRAASSSGHIYGKRRIYAEAFTSLLKLDHHPYTIKARGEELFCEGINHFVLHVNAHQPRDGMPGTNPMFGTAFHRNTPWFMQSRDWVTYLQRCHTMLQQGDPVADVAVYIGDFAPQMTGPAKPVPAGYDYDFMGSDAILRKLDVVNGEWVVYDEHDAKRISARYALLAMPDAGHIRPQVTQRLAELKAKGGRIVDGVPVAETTLKQAGITPIVSDASCALRWKARSMGEGMVFFLSNFEKAETFEATLRVSGMAPELFNPVTGEITKLARYTSVEGGTRISIHINDPSDSCFIVFRHKPATPSVVKAQLAGTEVPPAGLHLFYDENNALIAESEKARSYTLTMSDGTTRELVVGNDSQTFAIDGPWSSTKQDENGYSVLQDTTFELPVTFGDGQRMILDLGQVQVMARVKLNGKEYDTLWMPPFTLDVTDHIKPGANQLQVLVTSTSMGQPKLGTPVQLKAMTPGR